MITEGKWGVQDRMVIKEKTKYEGKTKQWFTLRTIVPNL